MIEARPLMVSPSEAETGVFLAGKVAVITGGASDIGGAIARAFARQGCRLVLAGRRRAPLEEVAHEVEGLAVPSDVSVEADVVRLMRACGEACGRLDVLVNNAGTSGAFVNAEDMDGAAWDATFAVNLRGVALCIKHAVPLLKRQGGAIVNMSSLTGLKGYPMRSDYAASRFAVIGVTTPSARSARRTCPEHPVMSRNAYPFAINTYSYTLSHEGKNCISHLAAQGYTDVELMVYPGHVWPQDMDATEREDLRRHVAAEGLRILTLNTPNIDLNIAGAAAEVRASSVSHFRGMIELAGDLGVPGVIVGPGKANPLLAAPKERMLGYFYEGLDTLIPVAEDAGTEIYVENMPFAFLPDADGLMAALDDYGNDRIGVVYDVANGVFIGEDPAAGLNRVRERLRLVHLSDTGTTVYRHDPVGRGVVPFAGLPRALKEVGYGGLPVLEIISPEPDREIRESADELLAMGWPAAPS